MPTAIQRIISPELFFGFVAPIGASLSEPLREFRTFFEEMKYKVVELKVTDFFNLISGVVAPKVELKRTPAVSRYNTYIQYGNQLRAHFEDDAILAVATIARLMKRRISVQNKPGEEFNGTVYLVHQFKRREELDLFRSVYGRLFFQVSVYSRRGSRVDFLSREFARTASVSDFNQFRSDAEKVIQDDDNQKNVEHGQRVGKIFHDADFIVSLDAETKINVQVGRFCELLFGSNSVSPTKYEYGLFMAKAAALRSLDLSRQVGVAIFSPSGEIVSLGCNEVPKAGGGTYWGDETRDDRDYVRKKDSNYERKCQILSELFEKSGHPANFDELLKNGTIDDTQFMDALEYGRMLHAEMNAITDAARRGISTKDSTLYTTTFPCHMCAIGIVGAGISKVVFLEPYPKSLAFDLHADSIEVEGGDRGQYQNYSAVKFEHFFGVSPRRYRGLFERGRRKTEKGEFLDYVDGEKRPVVDIKLPFYHDLEKRVVQALGADVQSAIERET